MSDLNDVHFEVVSSVGVTLVVCVVLVVGEVMVV